MDKIEYGDFVCEHLLASSKNIELIKGFTVKRKEGKGLERYLKTWAEKDENVNEARTYLVKDKETNEVVGYFSLKAGTASVNEKSSLFKRSFDTLPGIELANFAVNDAYKEAHTEYEGIGKIIFIYFVLPIVKEASEMIGVNLLFIYALPQSDLINHYKTYGFIRLPKKEEIYLHRRVKPRYDESCIFMYQKL